MSAVLVVHPGLQHSYQLAWGLHEAGVLQRYWSGVPIQSDGSTVSRWLPERWSRKLKRAGFPASFCRHFPRFPLVYRAVGYLPAFLYPADAAHRVDHWFDKWAAQRVAAERPQAVVAYENAALDTFRAAKAIGARCILDAASFHHATGAQLNPVAPTPYLAEINRRKDEEVALADLILTCSPLAAESYVAAGVAPSRLHSLPLGANLPTGNTAWVPHDRPLHFVFAGALSQRKAIDLIIAAFHSLSVQGLPYQLSFVGGEGEPGWIDKIRVLPGASYIPSLPQPDLFAFLAQADCLLLPSRYDAFGMVVAESMALGTPAIVSQNTGAKVMMEAVPGAGWVVDCTAESLAQCLCARIGDRAGVFGARAHAYRAAQQFTWQAYRRRAGNAIAQWLG